MLGQRGAETANEFMQDVASRLNTRIQLTTHGHRVYAEADEGAFGADIGYAMLVKIYGASNDNPESRYSPATCVGCRTGVLAGDPDPKHISTSFVERQNLSMIQQETREPRTHGCAVLYALQLLPSASDFACYTSDGGWTHESHLVHGGY
jgi:hypothetical protein